MAVDTDRISLIVQPPAPRRLRPFLESHDQLLTVLGAMVVFLGFYLKDGYREDLKDISTSLTAAAASQHLDWMFNESRSRLQLSTPEIPPPAAIDPASNTITPATLDAYLAWLEKRILTAKLEQYDLYDRLRIILNLIQATSNSARLSAKNELHDLQGRTVDQALAISFLDEECRKQRMLAPATQTQQALQEFVADTTKSLSALSQQASTQSHRLTILNNSLLDETERYRLQAETNLKRAKYASYLLFLIGWCLGLLGKLLKLPALQPSPSE